MLVCYYGFNVFFDSKVVIKRDVRYHLKPPFLARPTLVLVKMVNNLLFVQRLNLNLTRVSTVVMGRELNEDNFQDYFLL